MSITSKQIFNSVVSLMEKHKGARNPISKKDIFRNIFNSDFDKNSASCWLLWRMVLRSMDKMRHQSNRMIVSTKGVDDYLYYIIKSGGDAAEYLLKLNNRISSSKNMINRVEYSVKEKWYKDPFILYKKKE